MITLVRVLSALALASSASASDILELSASNFTDTVHPSPLILVEFMAPWCGHCKALMPEYERAASALKDHNIPVSKVDCTAEADLCAEHGVQGYPTLKVYSKGVASDYNGPRKADGIIGYMKKRSMPALSIVTVQNHTDFQKSDRVVVIAYLDTSDTSSLDVFRNFAESNRDEYVFGVVHDHSAIKEVGPFTKPTVILWKQFDEGRNDFQADTFTSDNIAEFVKTNAMPLMDEVSPNNFALYADSGLPLAYLFIEANNPGRESLTKSFDPIAREHKGKINFVWIDANKFADHGKTLGLSGTEWPAFVIQDLKAQSKYVADSKKPVDHDNIAAFVKLYSSGKLQPTLKSAPVPAKQEPGAYTLVTQAFDDVVYANNNQKDVFVEFYAPWCGHCKRLKPIYDNLARSFVDSADKVLIAKFDATENDVPPSSGVSVSGFPTLKFKPAGSKEFMDYDGDRSLDSMIEFVEKNSANHVKAIKVEAPEEPETETGSDQIVLDDEDSEAAPLDGGEDKDAEHDEL